MSLNQSERGHLTWSGRTHAFSHRLSMTSNYALCFFSTSDVTQAHFPAHIIRQNRSGANEALTPRAHTARTAEEGGEGKLAISHAIARTTTEKRASEHCTAMPPDNSASKYRTYYVHQGPLRMDERKNPPPDRQPAHPFHSFIHSLAYLYGPGEERAGIAEHVLDVVHPDWLFGGDQSTRRCDDLSPACTHSHSIPHLDRILYS